MGRFTESVVGALWAPTGAATAVVGHCACGGEVFTRAAGAIETYIIGHADVVSGAGIVAAAAAIIGIEACVNTHTSTLGETGRANQLAHSVDTGFVCATSGSAGAGVAAVAVVGEEVHTLAAAVGEPALAGECADA
jgi:hypothetical protein